MISLCKICTDEIQDNVKIFPYLSVSYFRKLQETLSEKFKLTILLEIDSCVTSILVLCEKRRELELFYVLS